MREILFRGKTYNDKWVQGLLVQMDDHLTQIRKLGSDGIGYYDYSIVPSTVGQYTGLTDKNGKKIFEGIFLRFMKVPKTTDIKYVMYIPMGVFYVLIMKHRNGISMHSLFLTVIMSLHLKSSETFTIIMNCWRWKNERDH